MATKQSPDEMIRARHRSVSLRAHSMGLRNYPSSEPHIPPPVRTYSFSSLFRVEGWVGLTRIQIGLEPETAQCTVLELSTWPGRLDIDEPLIGPAGQGKIPQTAANCRNLLPNWLKMPDNCRGMSVNCLTMTENCQNAQTVRKLGTYWHLTNFFPLSYNRLNLIYLHGKQVVIGFQARGIQIWYYFFHILARRNSTGKTSINNYLYYFDFIIWLESFSIMFN